MDLVTTSLLKAFKSEQAFPTDISDPELFEHFANYCVTSQTYGDELDLTAIHTGGADDLGLDGVVPIVNGTLVTDVNEVDDLADINKHIEAELIFCQSKTGTHFDGAEISAFFDGVKELLSDNPSRPRNSTLTQSEILIRKIYTHSAIFKKGNPLVRLYYVTTGKWQDDSKLTAIIAGNKVELEELNIFGEILFIAVDAREVQRYYNRANNRFSKSINFTGKITLPALPEVQESYLGYLPISEYLKLITDDSGNIVRGLFYDNVRDYQGENPVNREISVTLNSPESALFVLLNNGVTVVAEALSKTGDQFTIEDYQVVNGCQTSYVLYNNQSIIAADLSIPIKLIVSKDASVKNQVIKATNRQTQVKTEELTALTDFQKGLEDYYSAHSGETKLYYERRSQQYRTTPGIEKIRIVSISSQIRSFASMYLELPHQAGRYYGTLLKRVESQIFIEGHPSIAYYASALALYRLESFLRRKVIDNNFRPFKYHLLALLRIQVAGQDMPSMQSNKFIRYCEKIVDVIVDENVCLKHYQKAVQALDSVLDGDYERDKAKDVNLLSLASVELSKQ